MGNKIVIKEFILGVDKISNFEVDFDILHKKYNGLVFFFEAELN